MTFLVVNDDDVALLRFTCDLFFVEESPLYYLEAEKREPSDFGTAYERLQHAGVVDPSAFRITDDALNRLAPITECDGRILHLVRRGSKTVHQQDYYLLEGIAVRFIDGGHRHTHGLGQDFDQDEFVDYLGRRFVPRKSTGDRMDVRLSPAEAATLAALCKRQQRAKDARAIELSRAEVQGLLDDGGGTQVGRTRSSGANLKSVLGVRTFERSKDTARPQRMGWHDDPVWDGALAGLVQKGLFRINARAHLEPSLGLRQLMWGLGQSTRHTLVRYDFGDDEWFMRETTLVPVDGSLFRVGIAQAGQVVLEELNGERLRTALSDAVGRLPQATRVKAHTTR